MKFQSIDLVGGKKYKREWIFGKITILQTSDTIYSY